MNEETEAEKLAEYKRYRAHIGGLDSGDENEGEAERDVEADEHDPIYRARDTPIKQRSGEAVTEMKSQSFSQGRLSDTPGARSLAVNLGSSRKGADHIAKAVTFLDDESRDIQEYSDDEDNPVRQRVHGKGGTMGEEEVEGREMDWLYGGEGVGNESDEDNVGEMANDTENADSLTHMEVEFPGQVQNWNLASYLPLVKDPPFEVAVYFKHVVSEYMLAYKKKYLQLRVRRDMFLENAETLNIAPGAGEDELAERRAYDGPIDDEGLREAALDHLRSLLQRTFTASLLKYVDEIKFCFSKSDQNSYFPINAGSHLRFTSAAVEFVKATLHVLGLDSAMAEEVNNLRRMLLAHLGVQEFHAESRFVDPALSFVLDDVICSWCHLCRDVDLLRDPLVVARDPADRWHCQHCNNLLDKEEIENRLMDKVERLHATYLLQDARCSSTRSVSTRLTTSTSELSKPLIFDTSPAKLREQLGILMRVAEFHQFELLKTTIVSLLA